MANRYLNLFKLPEHLYAKGSPIIIEAGALHKDSVLGDVVAQLKFRSIVPQNITSVAVDITCFNAAKEIIIPSFVYKYENIVANENEQFFGNKTLITLPDDSIRSFEVKITNVEFSDGSTVIITENEWNSIPKLTEITSFDNVFVEYFTKKYGSAAKFLPNEYNDLWMCTCGQENKIDSTICSRCGITYSYVLPFKIEQEKKNAIEDLKAKEEKRIAEEKQKQEEMANAIILKRKKKKRRLAILSGVLAIIFVVVFVFTSFNFNPWKNIVAISTGNYFTAALRSDGTVVTIGINDHGQCDTSEWTDIASITTGENKTLGIKKDGTVVATSTKSLSNWKDIVDISSYSGHIVGLKSNGSVIATGRNDFGQCDVLNWKDIVAISTGYWHTVGLKSDGTVVATGYNEDGQCDVSNWKDIVAISAADDHTIGLKKDGTVVAVGENLSGQCDVSNWKDIVAISTDDYHTVGLKSDGSVVVTGECDGGCNGCDNVSNWKDIVAISVANSHTIGLKKDGTVVAVGNNYFGQCNGGVWKGAFNGFVEWFHDSRYDIVS